MTEGCASSFTVTEVTALDEVRGRHVPTIEITAAPPQVGVRRRTRARPAGFLIRGAQRSRGRRHVVWVDAERRRGRCTDGLARPRAALLPQQRPA